MTVIAAVDDDQVAPLIAEEAARLAGAFDTDLALVHVIDRDRFVSAELQSMDDRDGPIPVEELREYAAGIAAKAAEDLDVPVEAVGLVGDPASRVTSYAGEVDADYVVVDGRKRTPIGKAVFSSVTQDILLEASCPVVTILHPPTDG